MGIKYNPAMVTLAREVRGLSQTDLATRLVLQQGTLSKLESGTLAISADIVKLISEQLNFPEAFFVQTDQVFPFGATTFYHRRLQSVPAPILRKIEARANVYRFHVSRLLKATDLDRRCRFGRIELGEHNGNVEEVARLIRADWHLAPGPVPNLVRSIESAGGIVIRFDFGTGKMFGLSEWNPPAPPIFFLNDNPEISADRDRFTLAHELGHILLHALPTLNMEKEADRFAGEFLMPAKDVRSHLNAPIKLHNIARLKPYWKVSIAALIERALHLGVVNSNQHVYLRMQLQRMGYGRREPAELDIPREQPSLLKEIIRAHISELGFGYSDLAAFVNMNAVEFREFHRIDEENRGRLKLIKSS